MMPPSQRSVNSRFITETRYPCLLYDSWDALVALDHWILSITSTQTRANYDVHEIRKNRCRHYNGRYVCQHWKYRAADGTIEFSVENWSRQQVLELYYCHQYMLCHHLARRCHVGRFLPLALYKQHFIHFMQHFIIALYNSKVILHNNLILELILP